MPNCCSNLRPGGWIEQLEANANVECDDGTLPEDSVLREWGPHINSCGARSGRPCEILDTMADSIRKAGFVDVQETTYKWPIGPWPRDKNLKEAGTINFHHWLSGMEGWCMWLLTKFGAPAPWSPEEVRVFVAKMRKEFKNPSYHTYQRA